MTRTLSTHRRYGIRRLVSQPITGRFFIAQIVPASPGHVPFYRLGLLPSAQMSSLAPVRRRKSHRCRDRTLRRASSGCGEPLRRSDLSTSLVSHQFFRRADDWQLEPFRGAGRAKIVSVLRVGDVFAVRCQEIVHPMDFRHGNVKNNRFGCVRLFVFSPSSSSVGRAGESRMLGNAARPTP